MTTAKPLHVSQVLEVLGRQGCFGINPAKLATLSKSKQLTEIKKRGFLFLRHVPHCDWHSQVVGFPRLCRLMKRWKIIAEGSWGNAGGKPVFTALTSVPKRHLLKVRRLASSFRRRGVVKEVTFILFAHDGRDRPTLLDGNHRALALQIAGDSDTLRKEKFRVIIGTSTSPCRFHGEAQRWVRRPLSGQRAGRYILDIWTP